MSTPSGSAPPPDPHIERISVEQIAALYRNAAVGPLGALVGAVILAGALIAIGELSGPDAIVWIVGGVACVAFHLTLHHFYWRSPKRDEDWRRWGHAFGLACLCDGVWWAYALTLLVAPKFVDGELLANMVGSGVAVGAALAFGSYLPAFQAIFLPIMGLAMIWNLLQGDRLHLAESVLIVLFMTMMLVLTRRANLNIAETLRTRFEKDALAEDLRRQKELAEQANLAKSRFLAAASHDLRQPVHALGMFVGALACHSMTDEMRRLVEQIESSVGAMDGLFNSLLDISKLDAGIVQSHRQSFPIGPLLARICNDIAAEALRKQLRLVSCPCSVHVVSDPVLLERILRNILSNAVHYTDRGRVLIGCRRGARLAIQIWDTGRGIAGADKERVFQEFYQVDNFERDRTKGLGLGLAIVKRLTMLLDHPLELRSQIGKGSMFQISLPIARSKAPAEKAAPAPASAELRGALILVIDDELMVQVAMRSLLASWGCEVVVASSGDEMLERMSAALNLSEKTVKVHVTAIFRALNVLTRTQAARAAREAGLV